MIVGLHLSGHEEPHTTDLCSGQDFDRMLKWMLSLPKGDYPAVDAFADKGKYKGTDELMLQLNRAALAHDPPNDGTDYAVETLLDRLGGGYPDETVTTGNF